MRGRERRREKKRVRTEKTGREERGQRREEAAERKERDSSGDGKISDRTLERGKTAREREKSEENFPPRASPRDGNISVARVRAREENRKEEREEISLLSPLLGTEKFPSRE